MDVVTCVYRFTMEQYRAAGKGDWKRNPSYWFVLVVLLLVVVSVAYQAFVDRTIAGSDIYWSIAPPLFFIGLVGYAFLYAPLRAFRKNSAYNQELIYTLGSEGYRLKTPLAQVEIAWAAVFRWKEKREGFQIYSESSRSFHWLPKIGFVSEEAIEKARGFLRENIREKKGPFWARKKQLLCIMAIISVVGIYCFTTRKANNKIRGFNDQAYNLETEGHYSEALAMRQKAWGLCRDEVARKDALYAWTESRLANNYVLMGEYEKAGALFDDALKLQQSNLPPDHADTIITLNCYSVLCYDQENYAKAADLADNAYHLADQRYGPEHAETLAGMNNLALADEQIDRVDDAEQLWNQVLRIKRRLFGLQSDELAITLNNLAHLYRTRGHLDQARDFYQQAYELHKKNLGDHPNTAYEEYNLASVLDEMGKDDEARPLLEDCLRVRLKFLGVNHPDTVAARDFLNKVGK